ncbi:MAG: FtsQ-type POTRA domain-containing protein [Candidatus Melainabacteria bacterium]|jgi:hypothetical protein|nr:FtsQ-type POTRA domain-containing protein [Candidatus Melainabacteria bacterium]
MSLPLIKKIFTTLILIALSYGIFYLLCQKSNLNVEIHGLDLISQAEIQDKLSGFDLANKALIQINPRLISKQLSLSPLVKSVKAKIRLFPKYQLSIFVQEAKPWAIYRDSILDEQAQVLIESKVSAIKYQSNAINRLYAEFHQSDSPLLELMSTRSLSEAELSLLKNSSDNINDNIALIAANTINGADMRPLRLIRVNKINNVFFYSDKLKFVTGVLNDELFSRVKRLDTVIPKMIELNQKQELAYVDLSLSTDEIILGKPN